MSIAKNNIDLSGKIALVTGASRGIGAAVAKAYAAAGAHVILTARTVGGLEETDDAIRALGGQATLIPLDLLGLDDLDKLGPTLADRFGALDIFVGNAGRLGTLCPLSHTDAKEWSRVMDVNLNANFRLIRTLEPLLKQSSAGRAIFVSSSDSVTVGRAYWGGYSVSKAALEAMMRVWAAEHEKTNLRINAIDPGAVRTKMRAQAKPGEDPETVPQPDEIMDLFLTLAASECTHHGDILRASSDMALKKSA
jgi:NAD(P)-dependent dehydrogenase (short-subunit alcohol dehydrogenase family)